MQCPKCQNETNVTDSRTNGMTVRRRRGCTACKFRFTTFEVIAHAESSSWVHMKNLVLLDKREAAESIRVAMERALNEALLRLIPIGDEIAEQSEGAPETPLRAVPY